MKFKVDRNQLNEILRLVKSLPSNKPVSPVHGDIIFHVDGAGDVMHISVLDKDFVLYLSVMVGLAEKASGSCVMALPATAIADLVAKAHSDIIDFDYKEDTFTLKVKAGRRTATIKGHDPADFPEKPMPKQDVTAGLTGKDETQWAGGLALTPIDLLVDCVTKVSHAAGVQPIMTTGIHFEVYESELTVACLDGQRMACSFNRELPGDPRDAEVLVPAVQMKSLVNLFSVLSTTNMVTIVLQDDHVFIYADNMTARITCISGGFPDFRLMIPNEAGIKEGFSAQVSTRALLTALDWASSVDNQRVELDFLTSGEIVVSSVADETGDARETIDAAVAGFDTGLVTYAGLLLTQVRIMQTLGYDELLLYSASDSKPLIIQPVPDDETGEGDDYLSLVMPLVGTTRLQDKRA